MPKLLQMDMQLVLVQAHFPKIAEICIWEKMVKARGGVEGLKMPYFDFLICYRAGRDESNAKNMRLIWLSLLEISRHKGWGLHAIVKEAWSLNCLISGRFFQFRRHFLKNWQGAVAWNLVGVFIGHSSRNLM